MTCYKVSPSHGLIPDGIGLRSFGYSATTPPVLGGPKGSGSDLQFSIDSSKLIVSFKGTTKPAGLGHIVVFDVDEHGNIAAEGTDNTMAPLAGVFGFALDASDKSQFYMTEVNFGGALLALDYSTNAVSIVNLVNDTDFAASCWAVYSRDTGNFYDINAASANLGVVAPGSGKLDNVLSYPKDLAGGLDAVTDAGTMYMLTGVNKILVLDLASGEVRQEFEYASMEDRPFWTGMAMWPADPMLSGGL